MFGKKNSRSAQLTTLLMKVNQTVISDLLISDEIPEACSDFDWFRGDNVCEYEIQILPFENWLYYHKKTLRYLPSPNASMWLNCSSSDQPIAMYWKVSRSNFIVYTDEGESADGSVKGRILFASPIHEIGPFVCGQSFDRYQKAGEIFEVEIGEEVFPICRKTFFCGNGVTYSNAIFSLAVSRFKEGDYFESYD